MALAIVCRFLRHRVSLDRGLGDPRRARLVRPAHRDLLNRRRSLSRAGRSAAFLRGFLFASTARVLAGFAVRAPFCLAGITPFIAARAVVPAGGLCRWRFVLVALPGWFSRARAISAVLRVARRTRPHSFSDAASSPRSASCLIAWHRSPRTRSLAFASRSPRLPSSGLPLVAVSWRRLGHLLLDRRRRWRGIGGFWLTGGRSRRQSQLCRSACA